MRFRIMTGALAALALLAPVIAGLDGTARAQALTPDQTKQVEAIVRRMIQDQPRMILDALQQLRREEEAAADAKALETVKQKRDEIVGDPTAPVGGNPEGDVSLVEFFDYSCPYCKAVADRLMQTVKSDGKVKLVFKEFPILGPQSVFASRAALAAQSQGKYLEFHIALMKLKDRLTDELTLKVAKDVGLDVERLKQDMASPEISRILERNSDLAEALNIRGTPAFVIGDKLVPGAVDAETLAKLIGEARKRG